MYPPLPNDPHHTRSARETATAFADKYRDLLLMLAEEHARTDRRTFVDGDDVRKAVKDAAQAIGKVAMGVEVE